MNGNGKLTIPIQIGAKIPIARNGINVNEKLSWDFYWLLVTVVLYRLLFNANWCLSTRKMAVSLVLFNKIVQENEFYNNNNNKNNK